MKFIFILFILIYFYFILFLAELLEVAQGGP